MATKEGASPHVEVREMSVDDEQVRDDWEHALGLNEVYDDPDALTITQLATILGFTSRDRTEKWAMKGVIAGTVERLRVYRDTGSGCRWQKAYKLVGDVMVP